jgi:hypothetical protein
VPALFSPRANAVARGSLAGLVVLAIVILGGLMVYVRTSFATGEHADIVQPIPFDHRIHANDLKIDCQFCHSTVARAANAGLPPTVACVGCHNKVWRESPQFAPVRQSIAESRPIAWRRVNSLPDFVYFDHSIHVTKGVGCATCHGRVDQMQRVYQARSLSMHWCVDCHRDPGPALKANHVRELTSCSTCHR